MSAIPKQSLMDAIYPVEMEPSICRMKSVIRAVVHDDGRVTFIAETDCLHVRELLQRLGDLQPAAEVDRPLRDTSIYIAAGKCIPHAVCVVPCSLMRTVVMLSRPAEPPPK